jgi:hypothetical protein
MEGELPDPQASPEGAEPDEGGPEVGQSGPVSVRELWRLAHRPQQSGIQEVESEQPIVQPTAPDVEPGSMGDPGTSTEATDDPVPEKVGIGQGVATPPLDPRVTQALRLLDQARALLWEVCKGTEPTTNTGRVLYALGTNSTASVRELIGVTGLSRDAVEAALGRLMADAKVRRVSRGVYALAATPTPPQEADEADPEAEGAFAAPPLRTRERDRAAATLLPPSRRFREKLARDAARDALVADLRVNAPQPPFILRPPLQPDDTEPTEKLARGETPAPFAPEPPKLPVIPMPDKLPEVDTSYEVVEWDPSWGPRPKGRESGDSHE